jgi:hypothetical protein
MTDRPVERIKSLAMAFVDFGTDNVNIYDIMFNRPIKQYHDYIGTPQEEISYDEYHNSLKTMAFAIMVVRDYLDTRPDMADVDPRFLTIKMLSALHGIVSLHNSGVLFEMDDNPEIVLKKVIEDAIRSITG